MVKVSHALNHSATEAILLSNVRLLARSYHQCLCLLARFYHTIFAYFPDPVVQWYYNNQMIKSSKYFQMRSERGVHRLTITGAFPEDEGTYKCIARNQSGEVTCIAHLTVTRKSFLAFCKHQCIYLMSVFINCMLF